MAHGIEIVDAQIHAPRPVLSWDDVADPAIRDRAAIEMALEAMSTVGVDAAVIHDVPSVCELAATLRPDRFAGIVRLDPETPDIATVIAGIRERPGVLGIRILSNTTMRPEWSQRFREGAFAPWFAAAQTHRVPVCLYVAGALEDARRIAREYPDLPLIIDHLGLSHPPGTPAGPALFEPLPLLLELKAHPNVAVKFTGVAALSPEPYPFADLWPHLHRVIEAFGPERLMWGSDYTRTRRQHTYAEAVSFFRDTTEVSESDKRLMFGETLRRWLRWPRPAVAT